MAKEIVKRKKREFKSTEEGRRIIDWFNKEYQTNYKYSEPALYEIEGRLKQGYKFEDFQKVCWNKEKDQYFMTKLKKYFRPSSLFRVCHMDEYLNEGVAVLPELEIKEDQGVYDQFLSRGADKSSKLTRKRFVAVMEKLEAITGKTLSLNILELYWGMVKKKHIEDEDLEVGLEKFLEKEKFINQNPIQGLLKYGEASYEERKADERKQEEMLKMRKEEEEREQVKKDHREKFKKGEKKREKESVPQSNGKRLGGLVDLMAEEMSLSDKLNILKEEEK